MIRDRDGSYGDQFCRRVEGLGIEEVLTATRSPLSLGKDAPDPRSVHAPAMGKIVELPEVGGLHHRYERLAA
jgi:hypothetical protein